MFPSDDSTLPVTGRLAGQRAVVTGAARGIGAEIARTYAREGATVFVLDIDILVNNAGFLKTAPLLDLTIENWDTTFAVNTRAMFVTTQVAGRAMVDAWTAKSPLARLATTTDVANMALFLASAEADCCTGQAMNVTGGMVMH